MIATEYPVYDCQSWEDFTARLMGRGRSSINERLYRGQRNPADLLSSVWEREIREERASPERLEADLKKFKNWLRDYLASRSVFDTREFKLG